MRDSKHKEYTKEHGWRNVRTEYDLIKSSVSVGISFGVGHFVVIEDDNTITTCTMILFIRIASVYEKHVIYSE